MMTEKKRCVIWGAGAYGRELLNEVYWLGYDVCAYCDTNPDLWGSKVNSVPIIGPEECKQLLNNDNQIEIIVGVRNDKIADDIRKVIKKEFSESTIVRNGECLTNKHIAPIMVPLNIGHTLEGKVALITGGGSGIGYAIAELFMKVGCKCVISGRNRDKLLRARDGLCISGESDRVQILPMDISKVSDIASNIENAAQCFSDNRIDILINNAGVICNNSFIKMNEEDYDRVMDTNVKGTVFMTQAMGAYMIRNHIRGHIVNISSSTAFYPSSTPYRLSKWAVRGFTLGAAKELLPYGIIVNAIAPGSTMTEMMSKKEGDTIYSEVTPSHRFCTPEEIATLALYLVSGFADQIVGDSINITGGEGNLISF